MNDFASMRVWSDEDATSVNPIRLEDIEEDYLYAAASVPVLAAKSSSTKKKRRHRRKKFSEEEGSVADSVLSSILSEESDEDDVQQQQQKFAMKKAIPSTPKHTVSDAEKQRRRQRVEDIKARRKKRTEERKQQYPSSDEEEQQPKQQVAKKNPFSKKTPVVTPAPDADDDDLSKNPFSDKTEAVEDDDLSKNPFSDNKNKKKKVVEKEDDDLSKNPFVDDDDLSKNPFSDKKHKATPADDDLSKNPFSGAEDSDGWSSVLPPPQIKKVTGGINPFEDEHDEVHTSEDDVMTVPSAATKDDEEESDEEDIIESSKRLLRCVDQRLQYQHQNDEIASLKKEIKDMKTQAEAMAEQLRRAVETKCDLVLAQNEMERRHEQELIGKDGEMRDLRKYIQDILEEQAQSELNFMNEISSLARTLDVNTAKHEEEVEDKDRRISQLEQRIETMRVTSVRKTSPASPNSFRINSYTDPAKSLLVRPSYE